MKEDEAYILESLHCKDCGWPIVFACCNDEMAILHPNEDYWVYCTNQGCINHSGASYGQYDPIFLEKDL